MKKKILSVVMACVMAVSCCSGVMAMAAYNDNLQTTTIETNDGVIFEIKDGVEDSFVGGMRRDSYIAVDSSLNDKSGSQMIPFRTNSDYPYYRVFVSNTSSYLDILSFLWVLVAFTLMKKDHIYNGLPVCAIRERVNRYTVNFGNMLTLPVTYGKMFLDRKAAVGVWPAAEVKNEARLGEGK